jgi:hypothetical protein
MATSADLRGHGTPRNDHVGDNKAVMALCEESAVCDNPAPFWAFVRN